MPRGSFHVLSNVHRALLSRCMPGSIRRRTSAPTQLGPSRRVLAAGRSRSWLDRPAHWSSPSGSWIPPASRRAPPVSIRGQGRPSRRTSCEPRTVAAELSGVPLHVPRREPLQLPRAAFQAHAQGGSSGRVETEQDEEDHSDETCRSRRSLGTEHMNTASLTGWSREQAHGCGGLSEADTPPVLVRDIQRLGAPAEPRSC
jgi:hypothetical protein